jgi:hypothetical protein
MTGTKKTSSKKGFWSSTNIILLLSLVCGLSLLLFKLQYHTSNSQNNSTYNNAYRYVSNGQKLDIPEYSLSFFCPIGWECYQPESADSIYINEPNELGKTYINIERLTIDEINNPNYRSVAGWFDALRIKDPKSIGSNLNMRYGAIPADGTDAVDFPFYRDYDLNLVEELTVNTIDAIRVENETRGRTEYLFVHSGELYIFSYHVTNPYGLESKLVEKFLNSIEFI